MTLQACCYLKMTYVVVTKTKFIRNIYALIIQLRLPSFFCLLGRQFCLSGALPEKKDVIISDTSGMSYFVRFCSCSISYFINNHISMTKMNTTCGNRLILTFLASGSFIICGKSIIQARGNTIIRT